jgi:galactose mutarotase-like enzyme
VLADKGADIYEFLFKPNDVDLLWRSPNGIVNPSRGVASIASSSGTFMDSYEGGWQELFPTLGRPTSYDGAELGDHGEVAMLPWDWSIERDDPDNVAVNCEVACRRTPFRVRRGMRLDADSPVLRIYEEVENEGAEPIDFMWGHHPVLGAPFLRPGCHVSIPGGIVHPMRLENGRFRPSTDGTVWPIYEPEPGERQELDRLPAPDPRHVDELYISDLADAWYAVTNPDLGVGFALRWDAAVFPYLWMWRTLGPSPHYPWYGRTYTLALEPFSSVPPQFDDARQSRTLLHLAPGETLSVELVASAFEGRQPATGVTTDGEVMT